ncbi:MAG: hypothetical protein ABFD92_02065 [Planctomycetaceae bacterium]|nr:hypothetical protein [Planctomycetaceae bacterium]
MNKTLVKYTVGLRLAKAGIKTFAEAARRMRISRAYLSNLLSCRRRNPDKQKALADLCRCRPQDIFGAYTHPSLLKHRAA